MAHRVESSVGAIAVGELCAGPAHAQVRFLASLQGDFLRPLTGGDSGWPRQSSRHRKEGSRKIWGCNRLNAII